jgi:hypothetical protein
MSGFFGGVTQEDISIRGHPAKSPLFYRDVGMMFAVFTARRETVAALLPSPRLEALSLLPWQGLVAIHCFEYRDCDIGPYNEVSISIGARLRGPLLPGAGQALRSALTRSYGGFVVSLPVSTEVAVHGGVDFFNYPKYLADIRFVDDALGRRCEVRDVGSGALIHGFRGKKVRTRPPRAPSRGRPGTCTFVSYPVKEGKLWKATVLLNELDRGIGLGPGAFEIEHGGHARSRLLADLGAGTLLQYVHVPRAEAILLEPVPV